MSRPAGASRSWPVRREPGVGFVPYSPLGHGFLTGRIRSTDDLADDDWRRTTPRCRGENFQRNLRFADPRPPTPGPRRDPRAVRFALECPVRFMDDGDQDIAQAVFDAADAMRPLVVIGVDGRRVVTEPQRLRESQDSLILCDRSFTDASRLRTARRSADI